MGMETELKEDVMQPDLDSVLRLHYNYQLYLRLHNIYLKSQSVDYIVPLKYKSTISNK